MAQKSPADQPTHHEDGQIGGNFNNFSRPNYRSPGSNRLHFENLRAQTSFEARRCSVVEKYNSGSDEIRMARTLHLGRGKTGVQFSVKLCRKRNDICVTR
jgi:hypothetical protein